MVGPWVGLEIANMNDEGEVLLVQGSHQAVKLLLRHLGIRRVADDTELEFLALRINNTDECKGKNGCNHRS